MQAGVRSKGMGTQEGKAIIIRNDAVGHCTCSCDASSPGLAAPNGGPDRHSYGDRRTPVPTASCQIMQGNAEVRKMALGNRECESTR